MSEAYDRYLVEHVDNVERGWQWLRSHFPDMVDKMEGNQYQIAVHDSSKYMMGDEYTAYDKYFYGGNKSYQVVQDFNKAWLLHIHRNPHHWQYWVLAQDDGPEILIEMPYWYIVEMICDWWSFSWKSGNLYEIFDWYEKHKDHIKLNPKTRKTVEDILKRMREELDRENKD